MKMITDDDIISRAIELKPALVTVRSARCPVPVPGEQYPPVIAGATTRYKARYFFFPDGRAAVVLVAPEATRRDVERELAATYRRLLARDALAAAPVGGHA